MLVCIRTKTAGYKSSSLFIDHWCSQRQHFISFDMCTIVLQKIFSQSSPSPIEESKHWKDDQNGINKWNELDLNQVDCENAHVSWTQLQYLKYIVASKRLKFSWLCSTVFSLINKVDPVHWRMYLNLHGWNPWAASRPYMHIVYNEPFPLYENLCYTGQDVQQLLGLLISSSTKHSIDSLHVSKSVSTSIAIP